MKIICIGRNYADHIKEFDRGPLPREPMFFLKPDTALLRNNEPFYIPAFSNEIEYETELVVRINRVGRSIAERFAHKYYSEVGLGIDFTARDLQREAIAAGQPWEKCKGFDYSAAVSPRFLNLTDLGRSVQDLHFRMILGRRQGRGEQDSDRGQCLLESEEGRSPNGEQTRQEVSGEQSLSFVHGRHNSEVRQSGDTSQMIFGVDRLISYVSQFITLRMGDLLFTGTPAGVGRVEQGDNITAFLEDEKLLDFDIM